MHCVTIAIQCTEYINVLKGKIMQNRLDKAYKMKE